MRKALAEVKKIVNSQPNRLLLRGPEVADALGISRALAYRWMQTGVLPTVRVNGSVRVPQDDLSAWVKSRTTPQRNPPA
jgi:excisionase family DNA binding protein